MLDLPNEDEIGGISLVAGLTCKGQQQFLALQVLDHFLDFQLLEGRAHPPNTTKLGVLPLHFTHEFIDLCDPRDARENTILE
jgi:hypothetical protein